MVVLDLELGISANAQSYPILIEGYVSYAEGPLPGTIVMVQGTQNGTTTNSDGSYSIVCSRESTLVFSYTGWRAPMSILSFEKVL